MYNNPYYQQNLEQNYINMIDREKDRLDKMKEQYVNRSQPAFNQTIQVMPNNNGIKQVNSVEDVKRELAIGDTPFINNDYSTLWIKNAKGEIRTFELKEIKPKDEKDLIIEDLKAQIYQLNNQIKEMNTYEQQHNETSNEYESKQLDESIKNEATSNVSNVKSSKPKSR